MYDSIRSPKIDPNTLMFPVPYVKLLHVSRLMNQWGLVLLKGSSTARYGSFLFACPVSSHLVSGTEISCLRFPIASYSNICICNGPTSAKQLRRQKNFPILVVFESSENGKILVIGPGTRRSTIRERSGREDGKLDNITEHRKRGGKRGGKRLSNRVL